MVDIYLFSSDIVSYILRDNPKFVYGIRSSCTLVIQEIMYFERGEVITCMRDKCATEFVMSDKMMLREFYGAILLFQNENQGFFFVFLIKIILKKVFEYVINRLKHGTGHRP